MTVGKIKYGFAYGLVRGIYEIGSLVTVFISITSAQMNTKFLNEENTFSI